MFPFELFLKLNALHHKVQDFSTGHLQLQLLQGKPFHDESYLFILIRFQGDTDRDGYLEYGEFVAISVHLRRMGNDEHLKKAFEFFDENETGFIEIEELRNALADELEANSEEVISAIMHDVDTDKVWHTFCLIISRA